MKAKRRRDSRLGIVVAALLLPFAGGCDGAGASGGEQEAPATRAPETAVVQEVPAGSDDCPAPKLNPETGDPVRTSNLTVGSVAVTAEIADTPRLRESGLMNRQCLPENYGMLFVYGDEAFRQFWMRNTPISLDIAFLDRSGVVINILTMSPQSDENYASTGAAMFALEMEGGWFEANGVQAGDTVQF